MRAKIVRIGNSKGVRIPKPLLEQAGLETDVTLSVVDKGLLIKAEKDVRAGWEEAAALVRESGDDTLLDGSVATHFDETEWTWD